MAFPYLHSMILNQLCDTASVFESPWHGPWLTISFSFLQMFRRLLMRNPNTGALLSTTSSITVWVKRSMPPPQVCWWMASLILPTIRTVSVLGCYPMLIGIPLLKTLGGTSEKVSFHFDVFVCCVPVPQNCLGFPVAN